MSLYDARPIWTTRFNQSEIVQKAALQTAHDESGARPRWSCGRSARKDRAYTPIGHRRKHVGPVPVRFLRRSGAEIRGHAAEVGRGCKSAIPDSVDRKTPSFETALRASSDRQSVV